MLLGLPSTGKTTFLAALWEVVSASERSGLRLQHLYEGDRSHITARHEEWLACKPVRRTTADQDPISLSLRRTYDARTLRLTIPDMSGETYRLQFEQRRWGSDFEERFQSTTSLMVFVRSMAMKEPTPLSALAPALREMGGGDGGIDSSDDAVGQPASTESQARTWSLSTCCTQVKYVDLLQFIAHARGGAPIRVAVVVSAVDELDGTELENKPAEFVRAKLALLHQFLVANPHRFTSRIYGISAQGAKYTPESLANLRSRDAAADRIRVVEDGNTTTDITRPLSWLSFDEE